MQATLVELSYSTFTHLLYFWLYDRISAWHHVTFFRVLLSYKWINDKFMILTMTWDRLWCLFQSQGSICSSTVILIIILRLPSLIKSRFAIISISCVWLAGPGLNSIVQRFKKPSVLSCPKSIRTLQCFPSWHTIGTVAVTLSFNGLLASVIVYCDFLGST